MHFIMRFPMTPLHSIRMHPHAKISKTTYKINTSTTDSNEIGSASENMIGSLSAAIALAK